jgi:hypothetical protein
MSEKRYYVVGVTEPAVWDQVHTVLTQDGSTDATIPARAVECTDTKEHSPTRAVYLLTDEEAALLANNPDIRFVQLDQSRYPDLYPRPSPDELRCTNRYSNPVKNYRNYTVTFEIPDPATPDQLNRAGYQLLRSSQYVDPWLGQASTTVIDSAVPKSGTGQNIDVIVGDDGCWFGHIEFINNTGDGPADYVGGNKLPGNGICDLLDLVLDGPYYIDPAWFDADPGTRLTTRWDGTVVPVESAARNWWGNSANRSVQFSGAGTVTIPVYYTRANCNGSDTDLSTDGDHGTACSALAYGRTFGWAYNANKWVINAYGFNGMFPVDNYFDLMKIFHLNKPINPATGTQDPSISSNSWGYRVSIPDTGFYYFRQGTSGSGGVAYTGVKPEFMRYIGYVGDNRVKGEMIPNNLTTAGDELIASGVIFVGAAGNDSQQQVNSTDPNFNNYWSTSNGVPLNSATHTEFDATCYNTINRRGFPQQLGKYTDGGNVVYPVINIGALDDEYNYFGPEFGKEWKVDYSDMGNEVDCYAPGNDTLSACRDPDVVAFSYPRWDNTYSGSTIDSFDRSFNGTSSACPVACGLIATMLETNRSWGWADVKAWLQTLPEQPVENFYQGPNPQTATSADWADVNSLAGGTRRVIYNAGVATAAAISGAGLSINGAGLTITFS